MKKILSMILAAVMCFSLTSCGKKDEAVTNTEVMIRAIKTVTDRSGEDIARAEKFYNRLTAEQKSKVSNYDTLIQARETYNGLIMYGQWIQFGKDDTVTFTLADDGSFTTSDGRTGKYEISDDFVMMLCDDGDTVTFEKEMKKNLMHLKSEDADYIRPDLLTVTSEEITNTEWTRYFEGIYHLHIEKDDFGLATDFWNSYVLTPLEQYKEVIAPGTEVTFTMEYTGRDVAAMHNPDDDTLVVVEQLTDPVQKTVTVTLPAEAFTYDGCCNAQYDMARGTTSRYKEYQHIYKTLEYLENATVTSFDGTLYYYDQLVED